MTEILHRSDRVARTRFLPVCQMLGTVLGLICLMAPKMLNAQYQVRLKLSSGPGSVEVSGTGLQILDRHAPDQLLKTAKESVSLRCTSQGVMLPGLKPAPRGVLIRALGKLQAGTQPLLGEIEISCIGPRMLVVNRLPLETYLQGVLEAEMGSQWPLEALKAQAVAARSFAMRRCLEHQSDDYDLVNSVSDQVFGKVHEKNTFIQQAVSDTAGEVLTFDNLPIEAMYSSCCAGVTLAAEQVFGANVPYLNSVEDLNCANCPGSHWDSTVSFEKLESALRRDHLWQGGHIRQVRAISARQIEVQGDGEQRLQLSHAQLRSVLGSDSVPSNQFALEIQKQKLLLSGQGRGHGVGMCQWGARGMAERGMSYRDILLHFYAGVTFRKMY